MFVFFPRRVDVPPGYLVLPKIRYSPLDAIYPRGVVQKNNKDPLPGGKREGITINQ